MPIQKIVIIYLAILLTSSMVFAQNASISEPAANTSFETNESFAITTLVNSVIPGQPIHLNVSNSLTGYRKMKLGNNPNSLYNPKVNVLGAGNTELNITLRDNSGNANWSKIRIRPLAKGSLSLETYVNAANPTGSDWFTISIPLSDFDPSIDFSQVNYIEFPYSADAGNFNIDISDITFTGSAYPYQWFGANKNDNKHNGNGGPGELVATLVAATPAISNVDKVEVFANNILLETLYNYPFEMSFTTSLADTLSLASRIYYTDLTTESTDPIDVFIEAPLQNQVVSIQLTNPVNNATFENQADILLEATVSGANPTVPAFLDVSNSLTGYRKLKIGYHPTNIYASGQNVIGDGNDTLEIIFKELTGFSNWSRIRIRPNATGSVNIENYVNQAGGNLFNWTSIKIPLSDFDPGINFYNLSYFEFPYSADAGSFEMEIQSMKFTGGTTPFQWFGESKTDNVHNGNGGPGELNATLIEPIVTGTLIEKVVFYNGSNILHEDAYEPYEYLWNSVNEGSYELSAKVFTDIQTTVTSNLSQVTVDAPIAGVSPLSVSISAPLNGDSINSPAQLSITAEVVGLPSNEPTHLAVLNNQSGYRKLKIGYNSQNLYGPANNVTTGGNDTLLIILKDFTGTANWQQIRIRPSSSGTVNLLPYVPTNTTDWFEIKIPLSDFDASIDFSQLALFEFPYSADAGYFELGIQRMEFIGGSTPFLWFGDSKTDNKHNGDGGPGELTASIYLNSPSTLAVERVEFYNDTIKIGEDANAPYELSYAILAEGSYPIIAVLTDNSQLVSKSDTVIIHATSLAGPKTFTFTVEFDTVPDYCTVTKAPVKYNKSFAYSFSLDDGKEDGFTHAYPMMSGGYIAENQTNYPGLNYTDGCSNDHAFKAAISWNSVNSSYNDLHVSTPSYMTWTQLTQLHTAGWDVLNHSYSHASYNATNYNFEIMQNEQYVLQQSGIQMSHFVVPSGDQGYVQPAFNNGYKAIYAYNGAYQGASSGIQIDNPLNYQGLQIYRHFLHDAAYDTSNISLKIDQVAAACQNGNHYWYNDFTHRIIGTQIGGSLIFNTFEWYMQYLEQNYGKSGSDCMWMAPLQEVYEYMRVKDESSVSYFLNGNQLQITVNYDDVPDDLRRYALSLNIDANRSFQVVSNEYAHLESFNGTTGSQLINLDWTNTAANKSAVPQTQEVVTSEHNLTVYPNPSIDGTINVLLSSDEDEIGVLSIFDMLGNSIHQQAIQASKDKILIIEIDQINLQAGTYLVNYRSNMHNNSKIVLVQ